MVLNGPLRPRRCESWSDILDGKLPNFNRVGFGSLGLFGGHGGLKNMKTTLYHPIIVVPGKIIYPVGVEYHSRGLARKALDALSKGKAAIYDTASGKFLAFKNNKDISDSTRM